MKALTFGILILTQISFSQQTGLQPSAYEHVFRHSLHLKAKEVELSSQGKASNMGNYYKDLAALSETESNFFRSVALAAVAELDALDQQAKAIIQKGRAARKAGEKLGPPPIELNQLQAQRNASLAKYYGNLSQTLGPQAFKRLEDALIAKKNSGGK